MRRRICQYKSPRQAARQEGGGSKRAAGRRQRNAANPAVAGNVSAGEQTIRKPGRQAERKTRQSRNRGNPGKRQQAVNRRGSRQAQTAGRTAACAFRA